MSSLCRESFNRFLMCDTFVLSNSIPIDLLPSCFATTSVVPVPANGSNTKSFVLLDYKIILVKSATGDCCLCTRSTYNAVKFPGLHFLH